MADQKISQLTPYTSGEIIAGDLFAVVDTTNSQTKNITFQELGSALVDTANYLSQSGGTMTGDLLFPDDIKASFGDDGDLLVYHDGTHSYVGSLKFDADGHIVDPVVIDAALDVDGAITGTSLDMNGGAVFNESGADVDFRIESDTNANAFFLQGSNGYVGIGTSSPILSLDISGRAIISDGSPVDEGGSYTLQIQRPGSNVFKMAAGATSDNYLALGSTANALTTGFQVNNSDGALRFRTGNAERMRIGSNGAVSVGTSVGLGQFVSERPAGAGWALAGKTVGIANEGGLFFNATNDGELVARNASGTVNVLLNSNGNSYLNGGSVGIGTSSPSAKLDVNGTAKAKSYVETYVTLSGTTPTITCTDGNFFGLNTTGNTTFTFASAPASGTGYGFSLRLTAGGTHTLTWPASVKWPGGTAPDNPASGETNIYAFVTHDGGTTWYGMVGGEAFA